MNRILQSTWMAVAFITGETGLRMFLEKSVDYDAAEVVRLQDLMYKCMLSSATDYVVGVRAIEPSLEDVFISVLAEKETIN